MKRWLLAGAFAVLVPASIAADTVVEEIVARVNNSIITRSEYQRSREQFRNELRQQNPADADKQWADREKDVLRDLIDQQLLIQRGRDLGITADNEVIRRLDDIRKNMKLETMEELEEAAAKQGVSFEDFKQNLRESIITQQVIGREVGANIQISNQEVQEYYEKHKSEFRQPETARLSEILIAPEAAAAKPGEPAAEPTPEALAAAEAKAKEVLAQIRGGAKFEDVAKAQSTGPSANEGGDLGIFQRGQLAKQIEDVVFALPEGGVSDVIQTRQGYIILKVTEKREAGAPPLKDVERQIQEAIYLQKLQPAMRTYLTKLREEAYIDLKQGFVDTGASPNQTKPIFTTAENREEAPKKRKKKFGIF